MAPWDKVPTGSLAPLYFLCAMGPTSVSMSQEIWQYTVNRGDEERWSNWRLSVHAWLKLVELVRLGQGPQADSPKHKLTLSTCKAKSIPFQTSLMEKQPQSLSEQNYHPGTSSQIQPRWPGWCRGPFTYPRK